MTYRILGFEDIAFNALSQDKTLKVESVSYAKEHKIMLSWFEKNDQKWTGDLVRIAGLAVYGWMPTILRAEGRTGKPRFVNFEEISGFLNSGSFPKTHYTFLNGSVVGTSKFLHFWRPNEYAIWDSNIRDALGMQKYGDAVSAFESYLHDIRKFCEIHSKELRQVEFALFNAGDNGKA